MKAVCMFYEFPVIETINDVLPHIEGRGEFIVAEREHYDVINYVVAMQDTFHMHGCEDFVGAMRRECRGLIFDKSGKLISRPFHKFFNLGEREETQIQMVDFSTRHIIMDKADGSMARPLVIEDTLYLATKMGVTDIALDATKLINKEQDQWLREMFHSGKTPIMEYVSPNNKIVLQYDNPDLIILAVRDNLSGIYEDCDSAPFTKPTLYGSLSTSLEDYIQKVRDEVGREGDIIRFYNGHMLKVKADEYVRIHKVKDRIRTDRNILDIIIHEEVDDVIVILDQPDVKMVLDYKRKFESAFDNTLGRLEGLVMIAKTVYGGDRKRVALELVPSLLFKEDSSFIFSALNGSDLREKLIEHVKKSVGNTTRYENLIKWMDFENV